MALVCLYKHTQILPDEWAGQRKTERKSFHQNIFLLEAAVTNLSSPLGKHFQASQVSKIFAEGKTVWSDISERWLCSSSPLAQPKAVHCHSHVATPGSRVSSPGTGSPLLTSASTSFFFMPSEESSRFCSFSSSRSARSFAWRIFCSSSVASVLAFTAYQERGNRRWMATFIPFSKWGKSGTLVECPF